jgi:hypothetical protein
MKTVLTSALLAVASARPVLRAIPDGPTEVDGAEVIDQRAAEAEFAEVIRELRASVRHARRTASWQFAAAAVTALVIVVFVPKFTAHAVAAISESKNAHYIFAYEMLRGTGVVVALLAFLGWMVNLHRGSLDQATRFEKRLIASHALHCFLISYAAEMAPVSLGEINRMVLQTWGANVESAYTHLRLGLRREKDVSITGPHGFSVTETDASMKKPS